MKTMNKFGLCLWSGLALLVGQGASATTPAGPVPHFTLRVPLEMTNLHEQVTGVLVICNIMGPVGLYAPQGAPRVARHQLVGVDRQTGLPRQSAAVMAFDAPSGVDPRAYTDYTCEMQLELDRPGTKLFVPSTSGSGSPSPWGAKGSQPFRTRFPGTLKP